jgi:DNA (cytosine-5)-methyltransferase 1
MKPFIYNLDFVKEQSKKELFKVVSLFAGGGGSSTGYRLAGGKVLAINEFIPAAQQVYAKNYPDTHIFKDDVRSLTGEMILNKLGLNVGELDILDGSPPCSSFSMAGSREKGWGKEKKYSDSTQRTDDLFFEYARILKELQPKVFVAENVKGITMGEAANLLGSEQIDIFGGEKETIYHTLVDCGYNVRYKVLNAKNYGVPQSRERTIFIGVRKDIRKEITYPKGEPDTVTLKEAFEHVINSADDLAECSSDTHEVFNKLRNLKEGETYVKGFLAKAHRDKCANTLTASAGNIGGRCEHHWENRKWTVKEAQIISSFPDDFYTGVKYQQRIERLGRAVPPLMMSAIARHIYDSILK